jgi:DHA1 family tetracycline resistance protein-like MFS transporter
VIIALDAIAFGIVIPVQPDLVMRLGHIPPAGASLWLGALLTAFSAMQFFAAPVLGNLSDRFGRRPVLLLCLAGLGLASLATVFIQTLAGFFIIRILAGLCTGDVPAAIAYIADVTPPEDRAKRFGLVGAMFGVGFILGPAIGGILGSVWLRLPFLASAALALINVVYGFFFLAESLPPDRRRPFNWRSANPFGAIRTVFIDGTTRRLGIAWCCFWFALAAQQSSFILANEMRFHWNTYQNGLAIALAGLCSALTQSLLVGRAVQRFGLKRTAVLGFAFNTAGYACYAMAGSVWILFPGILILALGSLGNPAIRSMLSASVDATRQGEVQGALSGLQALMQIAAPLTMGSLFAAATLPGASLHFPGAPFLLAGLITLASVLVLASIHITCAEPLESVG